MSEIRFGGHVVGDPIGGGAYSTVFRAAQEGSGRTVAVKALKLDVSATSSYGAAVEREARVLSRLAHPGIVLLYDYGRTTSGRPYMVLEHVDGWTLADLLAKSPRGLSVEAALAIASELAAALDHAHRRGVVHRDLAPSNVLLSREGDVKLVDFGGAAAEGAEIEPSPTSAAEPLGAPMGTPAYCSPEQILGDYVDGRSDLFALGALLYEMLTGARPFEPIGGGRSSSSLAQRIRREPHVPLRARAPEVPRAAERIVTRLLEKAPADRYASAGVALDKLRAALRATTREATPEILRHALMRAGLLSGPRKSLRPPKPPRWRPGPFFGFFVIAALFVIAGTLNRRGEEPTRSARAAQREQPSDRGGLRVLARPWAHVAVDGVALETTPFARPIPLSPGRHWVRLTHPDAPAAEREVRVTRGEVTTLEVVMDLGPTGDAGKDAR